MPRGGSNLRPLGLPTERPYFEKRVNKFNLFIIVALFQHLDVPDDSFDTMEKQQK